MLNPRSARLLVGGIYRIDIVNTGLISSSSQYSSPSLSLSSLSNRHPRQQKNNRTVATTEQQQSSNIIERGGEHAPEKDLERVPRNPVLDRLPTPFPLLMDGNRSELGGEIDRPQSNGERMEESETIDKKSM